MQTIVDTFHTNLVPPPGGTFKVLLPPSYEINNPNKIFPLIIDLHGGNGSCEDLNVGFYKNAWDNHYLPHAVVVTPSAARSQYINTFDKKELWEDYIVFELIPYIKKRFHVLQGQQGTCILGVSMGGGGTLRIGFRYPELFAVMAAVEPDSVPAYELKDYRPRNRFHKMSAAPIFEKIYGSFPPKKIHTNHWNLNNAPYIARMNEGRIKRSGIRIYMECGNLDDLLFFEGTEFTHRALWRLGIKHEYRSVDGAHHIGPSITHRFEDCLKYIGKVLNNDFIHVPTVAEIVISNPKFQKLVQMMNGEDVNSIYHDDNDQNNKKNNNDEDITKGLAESLDLDSGDSIAIMNLFMEPEYKKMLDEDSKPGYGLKGSPKVKEEEDGGDNNNSELASKL